MAAPIARILLAAALVTGGTAVALPEAATAQQSRWRDVDGNNVTRVRHNGGGSFAETTPGRWTEFGGDSRPIHSFDETGRDAFSVTLSDRSRGVTVIIDLRNREIRGGGLFKRIKLLYTITDAEGSRRRGGGRGEGGWDRDDDRGGGRGNDDWGRDGTRDVEVGPIWSQTHAERRCRDKANEIGAEWTGTWTTVRAGMSVCGMRRLRGGGNPGGGQGGGVIRQIEVGPIWSQRDAEAKCPAKARELRGEWTGQWRTTRPGTMSECEIRLR